MFKYSKIDGVEIVLPSAFALVKLIVITSPAVIVSLVVRNPSSTFGSMPSKLCTRNNITQHMHQLRSPKGSLYF